MDCRREETEHSSQKANFPIKKILSQLINDEVIQNKKKPYHQHCAVYGYAKSQNEKEIRNGNTGRPLLIMGVN